MLKHIILTSLFAVPFAQGYGRLLKMSLAFSPVWLKRQTQEGLRESRAVISACVSSAGLCLSLFPNKCPFLE